MIWVLGCAAVCTLAYLVIFRGIGGGPHGLSRQDGPDQEESIKRLIREGPAERWPDLVRQVAKVPGGENLARTALHEAMDADPDAAGPVLAAYLEQFPDPHWGSLWEIKLKIKQKKFDEAIRLFR